MAKLVRIALALLPCIVFLCSLTAAATESNAMAVGDELTQVHLEKVRGDEGKKKEEEEDDEEFLEIDIERVRESIRQDSLSESGNHYSDELEAVANAANAQSSGSILHGIKRDGSDSMDIPVMNKEYFSDQAAAGDGATEESGSRSSSGSKMMNFLGVPQARSLFNRLRSSSDEAMGSTKQLNLEQSTAVPMQSQMMNEQDSTGHHVVDSSVSAHNGKEDEDDVELSNDAEVCNKKVAASSSVVNQIEEYENPENKVCSLLQDKPAAVKDASGGSTPTFGWEYVGGLEEEEEAGTAAADGIQRVEDTSALSPTSKEFVSVTSPLTIMSHALSVGSGLGEEDHDADGQAMLQENVPKDEASTADPTFFIESVQDQGISSPRDMPTTEGKSDHQRIFLPLTARKRQLSSSGPQMTDRSEIQSPLRMAKRPYTSDQPKCTLHASTSTESILQSTASLLSVFRKQKSKQLDEDGRKVVTTMPSFLLEGDAAATQEHFGSIGASIRMEEYGESKQDDLSRPNQSSIASSTLHRKVRAPWSWRFSSHQSSPPEANATKYPLAQRNSDVLVEKVNQAAAAAAAAGSGLSMQPDQSSLDKHRFAFSESNWTPTSTGLRRVRSNAATEDPRILADHLTSRLGFMSRSDPNSDATSTAQEGKRKMTFGTEPWIAKEQKKDDVEQYDVENPMVPVGGLYSDCPNVIINIQQCDEDDDGSLGDLRQNPLPIGSSATTAAYGEEDVFNCCTCFTHGLRSMSSFLNRTWKQCFHRRPKDHNSSGDDPEALYRHSDVEMTAFCDLSPSALPPSSSSATSKSNV